MIQPDADVLIYGSCADAVDHACYRRWLGATVNGGMAYGVSPQILARERMLRAT